MNDAQRSADEKAAAGRPMGADAPETAAGPMHVCIVYAYPSLTSGHGPKILQKVLDTLREAAVDYDLLDLYRERFNPVMSEEEITQNGASAWPDVQGHQAKLAGAQAWIFLYPVWWSAAPAMLKGWTDRVLASGFAYRIEGKKMLPLLGGKRALIVRTFGQSAAYEEKMGHGAVSSMDKAVLGVCGVKAVAVDIYSVDELAETAFNHALFGVQGAVRRVQVKPSLVPHHLRSIAAPGLPPIEQKPRLPVDAEGEEKIEMSDEAKADLEYYRSARRKARENVHQRADARQGGKPRGSGGGRGAAFGGRSGGQSGGRSGERGGRASGPGGSRPSSGGSSGFARGGDRFFGRKREGGPGFGSAGAGNNEGGIFSSGPKREGGSGQNPSRPSGPGFGSSRPGQPRGGGRFTGRPPQSPPGGKPGWSGGGRRRRR